MDSCTRPATNLAAQGRSLLVLNGYTGASSLWWRGSLWESGEKCWPAEILTLLTRWRMVLVILEEELQGITKKVEQSLPQHLPKSLPKLPLGLGALSSVLLSRELLQWDRFKNRREAGSFTGLIASGSSSGKS